MPELPDITVYVESLDAKLRGAMLERVRVMNPFVLRTAVPTIGSAEGRTVTGIERLGKRVVIALDGELFLVIHLMIAGRLQWLAAGAKPAKTALAAFEFDAGTLVLTEAGTKTPRLAAPAGRPRGAGRQRPRRHRRDEYRAGGLHGTAAGREPHPQARADQPAPVQRHRQRLLRRDPAPRTPVAGRR